MQTRSVYLDHNAGAPPSVLSGLMAGLVSGSWLNKTALRMLQEGMGNPSSLHSYGRNSKSLLRQLNERLAEAVGSPSGRFFLTSGGSEANSWVLKHFSNQGVILTSRAEHDSMALGLRHLMQASAGNKQRVRFVPLKRSGMWDLAVLRNLLTQIRQDEAYAHKPILISSVLAHHETGVIQPVQELTKIAQEYGALLHLDAVQALGKIPLDFSSPGIHFASFSFQKIVGPVGLGALYVNLAKASEDSGFSPLIHGHQQDKFRGGTENALSAALVLERFSREGTWNLESVRPLRQWFEKTLLQEFSDLHIVGFDLPEARRLPNTTCLVMPQMRGPTAVMALDLKGVCVSAGSACASGSVEINETLLAMGYDEESAKNTLRISLGELTSREDLDFFISQFREVLKSER